MISPVLHWSGPDVPSTDSDLRGPLRVAMSQAWRVLLPSLSSRPFRLSGLALVSLLGALLVVPFGALPVGRTAAGAAAVSSSQQGQRASPDWLWPVGPTHVIVRPFIAPVTAYAAGHRGIDVGATSGSPVLAPADGHVHFAGVVVDRPVLSIRYPGGLISSFEPVEAVVAEGTPVRRGDVIGTTTPGHCRSPCVHFGVRLHGEYVSPLKYLGGIPLSILLPTRSLS